MGLRGYLLKRAFNTALLVLFVVVVNFVIFEAIPGTQGVITLLIQNPKLPPDQKAHIIAIEEERFGVRCGSNPDGTGIPCPIWAKFEKYLIAMLTFQFGDSFESGKPVTADIITSGRLVNTLVLLGTSSVLAIIIGVFLGVIAARKRGG